MHVVTTPSLTSILEANDLGLKQITETEVEITSEPIGAGGFGEVFKGKVKGIQKDVAIKKPFGNFPPGDFMREAKLLASVSHPCCLKLLAICSTPGNYMIITEFMDQGSIYARLQTEPAVTPEVKLSWATQASQGIAFLHNRKPRIVHGDISSRNMLLHSDNTVKVADFGEARIRNTTTVSVRKDMSKGVIEVTGTLRYLAPELLDDFEKSRSSDVYAFGIFMHELAYNKCPLEHVNNCDFQDMIPLLGRKLTSKYEKDRYMHTLPFEYFNIVSRTLNCEFRKRPSMDMVSDGVATIRADVVKPTEVFEEFVGEEGNTAVVSVVRRVEKWRHVFNCCKANKMCFFAVWPADDDGFSTWSKRILHHHSLCSAGRVEIPTWLVITCDEELDATKSDTTVQEKEIDFLRKNNISDENMAFTKFMCKYGGWK